MLQRHVYIEGTVGQHLFVTDMQAALAAVDARKSGFDAGSLPTSTMVGVTRLALPQATLEITVTARLADSRG